jgi:hypothetical protein
MVHRSSWFNRKSLKNNTFSKRRRTGWEIEVPGFGEHGPSARAQAPPICKCNVRDS